MWVWVWKGGGGSVTGVGDALDKQAAVATGAVATSRRRAKTPGGSSFQLFANERLATAKRLASTTDRTVKKKTLKPEVLARHREAIRQEWASMTAEQRAPYKELYTHRLQERQLQAQGGAHGEPRQGVGAGLCKETHWGFGGKDAVVHPCLVQQAFRSGARLPPRDEVYDIGEFAVREPLPDFELRGDGVVLDNCPVKGRNICKLHPRHMHMSSIHAGIQSLVDRVGPAASRSCDIVAVFEGTGLREPMASAGPVDRVIALLASASFQPKFSDWVVCKPSASSALASSMELEFPVLVELAFAPTPLPSPSGELHGDAVCLQHVTSDELSMMLSGRAEAWHIRSCEYELLSPLQMRLTNFVAEATLHIRCGSGVRTAPSAGRGRLPPDLAEVLELNALCAQGRPSRPRTRAPRVRQPPHERRSANASAGADRDSAAPIADFQPEADPDEGEDEDFLGAFDFEADVLRPDGVDRELAALADGLVFCEDADANEDLEEADVDAHLVPDVGFLAGDLLSQDSGRQAQLAAGIDAMGEIMSNAAEMSGISVGGEPEAVAASSSSGPSTLAGGATAPIAGEPAAQELQAVSVVPPPPPPLVGVQIEGGPQNWSMTPKGHVFCDAGRLRGRITMWGTNVSVKCQAHGCSKAKGRTKVADGALAQWLRRGIEECPVNEQTPKDVAARRHLSMFPA